MTDKTLRPFQQTGVDFLTAPGKNLNRALFDDPGCGKTIQTIAAADKLEARRILILCPAVARINWQREVEEWQTMPRKTFVVKTSTKPIPEDADVVIMGLDAAANLKIQEMIFNLPLFDILVADEAHGFKTREALRTKGLYGARLNGDGGLISRAKRTWILTGTPMPNHSGELFTHLRALAPERLESSVGRFTYTQFLNHFCNVKVMQFGTKSVTKVLNNRNNSELRERLKGFYLRRKKEDVLKDLPPLQWGSVVLEPPRDALKTLKSVENDPRLKEINSILAAASLAHHNKDEEASDKILEAADKEAIASLRRAVGLAKVKPTAEFIEAEFDSGVPKIILFCYHREVISQMTVVLASYNPVVITGDTSRTKRQEAIDTFQNDPNAKIFIGQITAANSAITLTAADNVLLMEPSFVPAENVQAAARAHRIGQNSSCVTARYVVIAGSLDELITRILIRKSRQISEVIA